MFATTSILNHKQQSFRVYLYPLIHGDKVLLVVWSSPCIAVQQRKALSFGEKKSSLIAIFFLLLICKGWGKIHMDHLLQILIFLPPGSVSSPSKQQTLWSVILYLLHRVERCNRRLLAISARVRLLSLFVVLQIMLSYFLVRV